VVQHESLSVSKLTKIVTTLYPFLKKELFLHYGEDDIAKVVEKTVSEFARQEIVYLDGDTVSISQKRIQSLILCARTIQETLQRYSIAITQLADAPELGRAELEQRSQQECLIQQATLLDSVTGATKRLVLAVSHPDEQRGCPLPE
jgi:glycerol-3-phosphate O-acyltransferase